MADIRSLDACLAETDYLPMILSDLDDTFPVDKLAQCSPASTESVSEIAFDQNAFNWEEWTLTDLEQPFGDAAGDNLLGELESQLICNNLSPPSPIAGVENDDMLADGHSSSIILHSYGLTDDQLGDISLKKLRPLCKSEEDYGILKAYRRTCLNRHYARSSRTKQQSKTNGLEMKLKQLQKELSHLRQENDTKDATIRCLQLELQIVRSLKPIAN